MLTCGEIPALALLNGVLRLLPGTVGKADSLKLESFEARLLDYPQYTRPATFRGWEVPPVLRSGHHEEIERWCHQQLVERTRDRLDIQIFKANIILSLSLRRNFLQQHFLQDYPS